ncbi:MAG: 30S ribosomal protein S6 [Deltaproteobacteria bacterium]|nr:30S ribosomal protein S6 [Deltaproteobacteria bacterium]
MAEAQKRLAREYETTYLIKPETPDEQVEEIKERLRGVVNREGGKVIRFTNQGKRKTAFPVAKQPRALYIHCLYVGKPGLVAEFERNLKMLDVVTKFESIRVAIDVDQDARQVEADVVAAPVVEEERPRAEFGERGERGERGEGSFDSGADDRGED